jgi:hypothetical protein
MIIDVRNHTWLFLGTSMSSSHAPKMDTSHRNSHNGASALFLLNSWFPGSPLPNRHLYLLTVPGSALGQESKELHSSSWFQSTSGSEIMFNKHMALEYLGNISLHLPFLFFLT